MAARHEPLDRGALRWLQSLTFTHEWQTEVRNEYLETVRGASDRVQDLDQALDRALPKWSLAPVVASLVALRGVDKLAAIIIMAELGDISRFDSAKRQGQSQSDHPGQDP